MITKIDKVNVVLHTIAVFVVCAALGSSMGLFSSATAMRAALVFGSSQLLWLAAWCLLL